MSTAGKVLVVLVMLAAVACLILAGGVAKLNQNGNEALHKLATQLAKTQEDLDKARQDISTLRDQTTLAQEKIDRDVTDLRVMQTDLERTRSQVAETLARVQYELGTVKGTIDGARTSLQHRNAEYEAEEKAMDDLRREVQSLQTSNTQLMGRLSSLREQFQGAYHKNVEMLGKRQ